MDNHKTNGHLLKKVARKVLSDNQRKFLRHQAIQFRKFKNRAITHHMEEIASRRPIQITLETHSNCNARCVFCARRKIQPTNQTLPMPLFEKVCREYEEMGGGSLGFSPLISDPLLDPYLLERIKLVKEKFPSIKTNFFTNAIGFPKFSDEEISFILSTVQHINISIGGFNRDDYKAMFGVDCFEKVWKSLERLSSLRQNLKSPCSLNLHIRTHRKNEVIQSPKLKELLDMGYACGDILDEFSNWGGLVTQDDLPQGAKLIETDNTHCSTPCLIPMMNLLIMPDGSALACACMDANEVLNVGDVTQSSLKEIWTGEKMRSLRDSFRNKNLPNICKKCSYYTPYDDVFSSPGLKNYQPSESFWPSAGI